VTESDWSSSVTWLNQALQLVNQLVYFELSVPSMVHIPNYYCLQ